MAQIHEEFVVVKLSSLVKNGNAVESKLSPELIEQLEAVVNELLKDQNVIVEVEQG